MTRTLLTCLSVLIILSASCKSLNLGSSLTEDEDGIPDFKHEILADYQEPLFRTEGQDKPRWVKFTIVLGDSPQIYFQHSDRYLFHHDFVSKKIPGFEEISHSDFESIALYNAGRKIVLGAIIAPSDANLREYAIQLVGTDPLSPEDTIRYFNFAKDRVSTLEAPFKAYYLPTHEQRSSAATFVDQLNGNNIEIISMERWINGDQCYAFGWATGRLNFVESQEIERAYHSGRLKPDDILVTDGVPAEIPSVAGIVSLSPSTPNSHVALLAHSFRIPFAYVKDETLRANLRLWHGKYVALEANDAGFDGNAACGVKAHNLTNRISAESQRYLRQLKRPQPVEITPYATTGSFAYSLDDLPQNSLSFVGGKASNFRFLRQALPDESPAGIALSFKLWHDVMNHAAPADSAHQDPSEARITKLKDTIANRLAPFATYPPENFAAVSEQLKQIRKLIEDLEFTPELQRKILQALADFDSQTKIRFRSSTNVEDTANFSGAGLYDSFSGCLGDDKDDDTEGPSLCDEDENKERGVFRAIKKVLASFYNDNAFLERRRHAIAEDQAAMAILVHYSFPDEDELANGVITYRFEDFFKQMKIVSQPGANSVANPDPGVKPEVVIADIYDDAVYFSVEQYSSLTGLAANAMQWEDDYRALVRLIQRATSSFQAGHPDTAKFVLDFEYKKTRAGGLVIKQIRVVPSSSNREGTAPVLLAEEAEFCVFQGEQSNVFAIHRLKSRWQIKTNEVRVGESIANTLFAKTESTQIGREGVPVVKRNHLSSRQAYAFSSSHGQFGLTSTETFQDSINGEPVTYTLTSAVRPKIYNDSLPIIFPQDLRIHLHAKYSTPKPAYDPITNGFRQTDEDETRLKVCTDRDDVAGHIVTNRIVEGPGTIKVETSFKYPPAPKGIAAGYTAPLIGWVESKITGITDDPIVMRDYFSQTNRPGHHNFSDRFLFQPEWEPDLPLAQRQQVAAGNISLIYVDTEGGEGEGSGVIYTFDAAGRPTAVQGYAGGIQ